MFSLEPPRLEIKFMDYAVKRFKQNHLAAIDDMQRQTKAFMEHQIPAAAAIDLRRTSAAKVLATIQAMMPQLTNNFISAFLTADYNSEDLIKVHSRALIALGDYLSIDRYINSALRSWRKLFVRHTRKCIMISGPNNWKSRMLDCRRIMSSCSMNCANKQW